MTDIRCQPTDISFISGQLLSVRPDTSSTIKEETIATNCDWICNQASRLSHYIPFISHYFITINILFKLIT